MPAPGAGTRPSPFPDAIERWVHIEGGVGPSSPGRVSRGGARGVGEDNQRSAWSGDGGSSHEIQSFHQDRGRASAGDKRRSFASEHAPEEGRGSRRRRQASRGVRGGRFFLSHRRPRAELSFWGSPGEKKRGGNARGRGKEFPARGYTHAIYYFRAPPRSPAPSNHKNGRRSPRRARGGWFPNCGVRPRIRNRTRAPRRLRERWKKAPYGRRGWCTARSSSSGEPCPRAKQKPKSSLVGDVAALRALRPCTPTPAVAIFAC